MGDQSKPRGKGEMELLYELLKVSNSCVCWKETVSPEGPFPSSCLGQNGVPLFLVTIHSNHPKVFIEHLLAGGMAVRQAGHVPTQLTV